MPSLIRLSSMAAISILLTNAVAYAQCLPDFPASTPSARFEVRGDGTVRDNQTGLVWKHCLQGLSGHECSQGNVFSGNWKQALQQAEEAPGWRLPNIKELQSIVEEQCFAPAINKQVFPRQTSSHVWSSSPYVNDTLNTWFVSFNYGYAYNNNRNDAFQVRLVRSGQ